MKDRYRLSFILGVQLPNIQTFTERDSVFKEIGSWLAQNDGVIEVSVHDDNGLIGMWGFSRKSTWLINHRDKIREDIELV